MSGCFDFLSLKLLFDVQEPILQAGTPPGLLRLASCVPGHKESPAINFSTPIVLRARHSN
jgi:hypothetical protein